MAFHRAAAQRGPKIRGAKSAGFPIISTPVGRILMLDSDSFDDFWILLRATYFSFLIPIFVVVIRMISESLDVHDSDEA